MANKEDLTNAILEPIGLNLDSDRFVLKEDVMRAAPKILSMKQDIYKNYGAPVSRKMKDLDLNSPSKEWITFIRRLLKEHDRHILNKRLVQKHGKVWKTFYKYKILK